MDTHARFRPWRSLPWLAALLLLCSAQLATAQQPAPDVDPPGRVGHVSDRQGSVVFAPEGEDEWTELPQNRPLTTGDRLWSDRGARAEVHLGSATLHVDGESHVGVSALDDRTAQFILLQGAVNARVRDLAAGENFEVDTPHLAMRATQPGDYRVDVDPAGGSTRVVVHSGQATLYGEGGQSLSLGAGQQASFAGRGLAQVQSLQWLQDDFSRWAAGRNRAEDQSVSARFVPRGVVGYQQLDNYGTWSQDPTYGSVWYPTAVAPDWAPYRAGSWNWVDPWGWTWVDDAPWGFAPFHYGRWATIGNRWAWVPGTMAARPVYSPGLVVFMGGNGVDVGLGGPSVGWYPLAPGEAWWPVYRVSPRYLGFVNHRIDLGRYPRNYDNHFHRRHFHGVTVVREDDFRRGRNVHQHWRRVQPSSFEHGRIGFVPSRPDFRDRRGDRDNRVTPPRLRSEPPRVERGPQRPDQFVRPGARPDERGGRGGNDRDDGRDRRDWNRGDAGRDRADWDRGNDRTRVDAGRADRERAERAQRADRERNERNERNERDNASRDRLVREQAQAQREQQRMQREAERSAREQQREVRVQREQPQQQQQQQQQQPQPQRVERIERAERPQRMERDERQVRPERVERQQQRVERVERGDRGDRGDRRGNDERGGRN